MRRILVTGGAGFIGSNFVRYQLERYPDVHIVVFDKLTYAGNRANLADLDSSRYTFVLGDIADRPALETALDGCDALVNFAADTHVDRSIMGASEFIATNVTGVYTIAECVRALGIPRAVLVSTDEVYGSIDAGAFRETDPVAPRNPYAASKASGDLMALAHHATFGTPLIITRGSNTYGPYQHPEKVLPLFVTNAIEGKPLPLYRGGEHNVRDWLHVRDHGAAIDCVLRKGAPGEIYNIAGGNERENLVLTRKILELTGKDESLIQPVADRPGHDRRYAVDASKLRSLGWVPEVPWDDGMAATVAWYCEHETWWRPLKSGEFVEYYRRQYRVQP